MQKNYSLLGMLIFLGCCQNLMAQSRHYLVRPYKEAIHLLWDEDEEEEDTIRGVSFGLNLGGYFASKKTANFYNGVGSTASVGQNEVQYYSIEERLNLTQQTTAQINNYYNSSSFFLPRDAYPANMRYMPAFSVGLQIKYNMNRYAAIIFNVNGIKLSANDRFTVQFQGTSAQQNGQNDVRLFNISGSEQRLNVNLGYRQGWFMNDFGNFYGQIGGSLLGTRVQSTKIFMADNTFDLFIGASNPNQIQQFRPRTDIGLGGYIAFGFEFWFKSGYTADLSFGFSRDKMILLYLEENGWNKWLQLSFSI